ncbi:MAG: 2-C-methyl-D-erythritol 2,4-cyclodiphosphate synthase [Akkermansiaceae bacterium]|jgi:2-C-methyl-D-erythritol 2,4-cyclodiphosphate synthase
MKENIAEALGITPGEVGIKATTNETMGFVGRREGMAAFATALVIQSSWAEKLEA